MIKILFKIFFTVVALLSISNATAISKEAVCNTASFLVVKQQDTLAINYEKFKKFYKEKEYSEALRYGLKLADNSFVKGRVIISIKTNYTIAKIFSETRNYKKAIKFYKTTIKQINLYSNDKNLVETTRLVKAEIDAEFIKTEATLKLGSTYHRLKVNKNLKIYRDSSLYYYNLIINDVKLNKDYLGLKAKAYSNLAGMLASDSSYVVAKDYALKAISIHRDQNNKLSEAAALSNLANIYIYEKDYETAKKIYTEGLKLIENNKSSLSMQFKENLYENLGYSMYMLKDYKAYDFQEKSYSIKDSLRDKDIRRIIEDIYARQKVDIAEQNVSLVKNQVDLEKAQERTTNWFLGILLALILISSGVILYNYKLRQNNLKLKLDQTQLAQESKLEKLKSESQVRILNATLDGKETERKQIAETLHDSVSSLLSSANLHLQATKMQFNGDTPIEIDKTQKIIIEASQTIRDLSHTLVSSVLLKFGLKYAIKDMAEKYSNSQIQLNTDIKNLRRYHQNFEIKVNNIIQEFVNNVLKHSKASKAIVRIEDKGGKLIINIQDNGVGFDKKEIPEKDGLGINQIDARIQMMKGEFNIDSNSDNGTKIAIVLPIFEKEIPIRV